MSDKCSNKNNVSTGGIGIVGLVILFCNFDNSKYDLYDLIYNLLIKLGSS